MELSKKKILIFADWFVPGYKAGGPIRSCLHFVQEMKDSYTIFVITTDRDLQGTAPYTNVVLHEWTDFEPNVRICYCSPAQLSWKNILQQIKTIQPDFIYLNSMYSRYFTIYPLLMQRLGLIRHKIILAPRGMLKRSALQFHKTKKKIFLTSVRLIRIARIVHFHATDQTEVNDIRKHFGSDASITLASNFPAKVPVWRGSIPKREKELAIIFVGRLHPIKNLDYLLQLLPAVTGQISLTITGSEEDMPYVDHCKQIVRQFPSNIRVTFTGEIPNYQLPELLHRHHIFTLPTQGENFGHAIFEALAAGKPVLISDKTPWQNLCPEKAGWELPLEQKGKFISVLQQAMDFDQQQYDEWSRGAWQFANSFVNNQPLLKIYSELFA